MPAVVAPRLLLLGLLSWAIPFGVSFLFYGPGGVLWIAQPLFKSLMVVVGGASGIGLLILAFRPLPPTSANGLALGLVWLAINLGLDGLVLLPMSGMSVSFYTMDIGLRYLLLPMIAWAMGWMAESGAKR